MLEGKDVADVDQRAADRGGVNSETLRSGAPRSAR
jgi:hypothetical protein